MAWPIIQKPRKVSPLGDNWAKQAQNQVVLWASGLWEREKETRAERLQSPKSKVQRQRVSNFFFLKAFRLEEVVSNSISFFARQADNKCVGIIGPTTPSSPNLGTLFSLFP